MSRDVIGLCYHSVSEHAQPHIRHLHRCKAPAQFERDLEFLCRRYEVLAYDALFTARASARGDRPRAIVTFDDGLQECHSVIRPLLLKYGVPAVFFVTTGFLDNRQLFYRHKVSLCIEAYLALSGAGAAAARRDLAAVVGAPLRRWRDLPKRLHQLTLRTDGVLDSVCARLGVDTDAYLRTAAPYLTTEQVCGLAKDGFDIGAHGKTHAHVGLMTTAEAEADIVDSCTDVARLVGRRTVPYAFPFDGRGVSREMLGRLRGRYSQIGLFFDTRRLAQDPEFLINRIVVDRPPRMRRRVTNLPGYIRRASAATLVRAVIGRLTNGMQD